MAKRQRELAQKDRVKEREQRRVERRTRIQARVTAGVAASGPVTPSVPSGPTLGVDGPRSLAELRAHQAATRKEDDLLDRIVDPDEIERD